MRIKEGIYCDNKSYSNELHRKVQGVLYYVCSITEAKRLLGQIRKEALNMQDFFMTEEELNQIKHVINIFNARMQATVYYTLQNIERYQQYGWKELVFERENEGEKVDSI